MRTREAGKVNSNLSYLGRKELGMYLLEGEKESMLISAGISFILGDILAQIKSFGIDENKIKSLLILHSHFDHVGTVPYFKRTYPAIDIYASQRAWDILTMPKAIETMNAFSPALKTLLPSDAGGIPIDDDIFPSGNSNYTQFEQSLEKMKDLEVDYYCADHYGYISGEEARDYTRQTIEATRRLRARIEEIYKKSKDIESSANILTEELFRRHPDYFISKEIIAGVFGQMVKHIAKTL